MNLSNSAYPDRAFATFGRRAVSAILPDAIVPICSRPTRTVGSGPDRAQKSDQPANGTRAIGVTQAATARPSPTTVRLRKATTNRACPF